MLVVGRPVQLRDFVARINAFVMILQSNIRLLESGSSGIDEWPGRESLGREDQRSTAVGL